MTEESERDIDASVESHCEIIKKDEARQIVTAPVLVPEKKDRHGDVISESNIEKVAYDFMENHQAIDEMHDGVSRNGHSIVESYITPQPVELGGKEIRKGVWVMSLRLDDEAWSSVEDGTYQGISIEGVGKRTPGAGGD